jgi:hypothetical protein
MTLPATERMCLTGQQRQAKAWRKRWVSQVLPQLCMGVLCTTSPWTSSTKPVHAISGHGLAPPEGSPQAISDGQPLPERAVRRAQQRTAATASSARASSWGHCSGILCSFLSRRRHQCTGGNTALLEHAYVSHVHFERRCHHEGTGRCHAPLVESQGATHMSGQLADMGFALGVVLMQGARCPVDLLSGCSGPGGRHARRGATLRACTGPAGGATAVLRSL